MQQLDLVPKDCPMPVQDRRMLNQFAESGRLKKFYLIASRLILCCPRTVFRGSGLIPANCLEPEEHMDRIAGDGQFIGFRLNALGGPRDPLTPMET